MGLLQLLLAKTVEYRELRLFVRIQIKNKHGNITQVCTVARWAFGYTEYFLKIFLSVINDGHVCFVVNLFQQALGELIFSSLLFFGASEKNYSRQASRSIHLPFSIES